jgi:hypothetical protein
VIEAPREEDGFGLQAPEDTGEVNTGDLADETVDEE